MSNSNNDTIKVWVSKYSDKLYTWAFHKTSSKEISEDLVQETFMVAITSFEKFQHKSSPETWLFSILNFKIIDFYKKNKNKPFSLHQINENHANDVVDSLFNVKEAWANWENKSVWNEEKHLLDDVDFNSKLEFCLDDLPQNWRLAISAKYILNKKSEEICQELEMSKTNYWQIIHRAKLLLKICIEKHWI